MLWGWTIFLGAFLLFQVQPILGRFLLPWFGGGTGVWTVCLLFFQTALLGGYLYAHLLTRRLPPWGQAAIHAVLLGLSFLFLPLAPDAELGRRTARGTRRGPCSLLLLAHRRGSVPSALRHLAARAALVQSNRRAAARRTAVRALQRAARCSRCSATRSWWSHGSRWHSRTRPGRAAYLLFAATCAACGVLFGARAARQPAREATADESRAAPRGALDPLRRLRLRTPACPPRTRCARRWPRCRSSGCCR